MWRWLLALLPSVALAEASPPLEDLLPPPPGSPLALGAQDREEFVEGELASIGAIGLVPWRNRAGGVLGLDRLGEVFFLGLKPEVNYSRRLLDRPFSMTFAVPLRLKMLDAGALDRWAGAGLPRAKDWDEVRDYFQVIQNITWGGKEKHFYLDINQFRAISIGHGAIVRRYNQNLDMNMRRVSAELDAFTDYGGGEFFLDDITGPRVLGGLAFVKPLSLLDRRNWMMRSFSIGFTFVSDLDAPLRNRLDFGDVDHDGRRANELLIDQETFQPRYVGMPVIAYGVDAEVKLWDSPNVDWKTYVDYSFLESGLPTDDAAALNFDAIPTRRVRSGGFTFGHLLRLNLGPDRLHAVRIRAEYRVYQPNYLPGYFDVAYQIGRVLYASVRSSDPVALANSTRLQKVLGRNPHGPLVHGGYIEASWRMSSFIALAVGLEMNTETPDNALFVHVEVPELHGWQLMATYHRRNARDFVDLFRWFQKDSDIFIARTRYQVIGPLAVALEAVTPFGYQAESFLRREVEVNLSVEFGWPYLGEAATRW